MKCLQYESYWQSELVPSDRYWMGELNYFDLQVLNEWFGPTGKKLNDSVKIEVFTLFCSKNLIWLWSLDPLHKGLSMSQF